MTKYSNTRAYSYLRFSTPEQQRGDSFRRQAALADRYALENGLILDTNLNFRDEGLSAFRGKNAETGQLGVFVAALNEGIVPKGSYLLVESLDRISRQTPYLAQSLLISVIMAGAVVVTLSDERKYDIETFKADPTALLMSVIIFMRAHEESETKSERLKAVWSQKRKKAISSKLPMTAACPGWLELDLENQTYKSIPDRAKIVKRIFELTVNGVGQGVIAQTLNKEGVPTFGRGKFWYRTYISKILENPAVIGTFIPHVNSYASGNLERKSQDPIKNYFPAIIEPEIFSQVEAMGASRQSRRGRHSVKPLNNLFGGLGKCALCGSTMTMTNKGSGNIYFVCTRAKAGANCSYKTIHYNKVETYFKLAHKEILDNLPDTSADITVLQDELKVLSDQLEWIKDSIANIVEAIENRKETLISTSLLERLGELEEEKTKTQLWQQEKLSKLQIVERNMVNFRIDTLKNLMAETFLNKEKVNAHLRQLFKAIHISIDKKFIEFEWLHSPVRTGVSFVDDPVLTVYKTTRKVEAPPIPKLPGFTIQELAAIALEAKRRKEYSAHNEVVLAK